MPNVRPVPESIEKKIRLYRFHQRWWLYLHYFVGIAGVIAGALASRDKGTAAWGAIAATAAGVVTFLGPQQRGDRYKRAQLRLESAVTRFQALPDTSMAWLLDEFDQVQNGIIGTESKTNDSRKPGSLAKPPLA